MPPKLVHHQEVYLVVGTLQTPADSVTALRRAGATKTANGLTALPVSTKT
jgi:hypothetical protein